MTLDEDNLLYCKIPMGTKGLESLQKSYDEMIKKEDEILKEYVKHHNRSDSWWEGNAQPMPFEALTTVEGDPLRHIEQLWDEIHKLKERVVNLENKNDPR